MRELAKKFSYKANIDHLINVCIREYDLEKAILGLLYQIGRIGKEQYQSYAAMPKEKRVVEIGCYMKTDKSLFDLTQTKMSEIRNSFLETNHIEDYQVLYIDNDSISIIDPKESAYKSDTRITNFGDYINFRVKNVYTSFYRLRGVDLLYNGITNSYRVKYGGVKLVEKSKDNFLDLLLTLANEAEHSLLDAMQTIKDAYTKYTNHELATEYYREFNQQAKYKLKPGLAYTYYSDMISSIKPEDLDISYNAGLLNFLIRVISKEYFRTTR